MINSEIIANYFIKRSFDTGIELTPMKLLKLVYISHGWYLASNDKPLISESIEAWDYGPVIRNLYNKIKIYGNTSIPSMIDITQDGYILGNEMPNKDIGEFLEAIWKFYSKYDGLQLSTLTHEAGSPWDDTIKSKGKNSIIGNDLIKKYYSDKLK